MSKVALGREGAVVREDRLRNTALRAMVRSVLPVSENGP